MTLSAEALPMTRLINTFLSFVFFTVTGGLLILAAPRLMETWLPATALVPSAEPAQSDNSLFTEVSAPALAAARHSDSPAEPGPGAESHSLAFGSGSRQWWGFNGATAGKLAPVVLLLHGSGRSGRDMLAPWQEIARREGLVLVAPDAADSEAWSAAQDGDAYLDAVLAAAAEVYPIDPERIYMFGHSAGANFTLTLAGEPPMGVRAIAGHAGADRPASISQGLLPIRLYIGDNDHIFPLDTVRASAKALAAAGHPTELVVIPGHDHWFYDAAPAIAADAWAWFATK